LYAVYLYYRKLHSSKNISNNPKITGLGNSFAAGIFFSVAFLDLIPDAIEHTEESGIDFADFPFLMVVAGYLLIFTLEKMVFNSHELMDHTLSQSSHSHSHSHSHSRGQSINTHRVSQSSATPPTGSSPVLGADELVQAALNPRKSFAIIVKESEGIDSQESTKSLIPTAENNGTINRYAPYLLAIALSVHSV
jgi:zinc transporter ZupT